MRHTGWFPWVNSGRGTSNPWLPVIPTLPPEIPWRLRLRRSTLRQVRIKIDETAHRLGCYDIHQPSLKQILITVMRSCGALPNHLPSLVRPAILLRQSRTKYFIPSLHQTGLKRMSSTVKGASGREYVTKDVLRKWLKNPEFNIYRAECVESLPLIPCCPFRP